MWDHWRRRNKRRRRKKEEINEERDIETESRKVKKVIVELEKEE